jgi:two-component system, OmpR family, phosphate regulon response regulator PhoB
LDQKNARYDDPVNCSEKTILVVEDTTAMRNIERMVLERAGYNVIEAGSVTEAITLLEAHRPDLALLDINLAGESGFDVVRAIRAKYPEPEIPVIILSGSRFETEIVQAHLLKPITKPALLDNVRALLEPAAVLV